MTAANWCQCRSFFECSVNNVKCVSKTLTAAWGVRALRASLSWVFVWGYLPRNDDINEVSGCDGRLAPSPELLFDSRLWGLRALLLNPDSRRLRISWVRLTPWQGHSTIWWLHGSPVYLLLLLFREACSSPSRHVVIPIMFAVFHLGHVHCRGRCRSIHQSSQSISCSTVARTTLGCCCGRCWMGPEEKIEKWSHQSKSKHVDKLRTYRHTKTNWGDKTPRLTLKRWWHSCPGRCLVAAEPLHPASWVREKGSAGNLDSSAGRAALVHLIHMNETILTLGFKIKCLRECDVLSWQY